jgi:hypothetical protein
MSDFVLIHPRDDGKAQRASVWARALEASLVAGGHNVVSDVTDLTPADTANIRSALGAAATLICYFGHGETHSWLTAGAVTVNATDFPAAVGKAVVSIACKTGCNLGPDAITSGVETWLGFTSRVAIMATAAGTYPLGDAIVDGLSLLGTSKTMQEARDEIYANLDQVLKDYDTGGKYATDPVIGYWSALAMRDHLVLHGNVAFKPL